MGAKQFMNLVAGKGGSKARRMRDAGLPIGRDIFLGAKARRPWPSRGDMKDICV